MKYCTKCGRQMFDEAVICPGCGCATGDSSQTSGFAVCDPNEKSRLLNELSSKAKTDGIIWLVIGVLQIAIGVVTLMLSASFISWVAVVGIINVISASQELSFSSKILSAPVGIVKRYEPLTGPVITLIYNIIFGGLIGVVGSIYYLTALRSFVLQNKEKFLAIENEYNNTSAS